MTVMRSGLHAPPFDDGVADHHAAGHDVGGLTQVPTGGTEAEPRIADVQGAKPRGRGEPVQYGDRRDAALGAPGGELARHRPAPLEHHSERAGAALDENAEGTAGRHKVGRRCPVAFQRGHSYPRYIDLIDQTPENDGDLGIPGEGTCEGKYLP